MNEMIERVARALFDASQKNLVVSRTNELLYGKSDVTWEYINSEHVVSSIAEDYRTRARAAIEAMREPTEAMLKSGDSSRAAAFGCVSTWQEMIDAALGKVDA
jgi:hypothetical protein